VAVLAEGLWIATDPPSSALWVVRDGDVRKVPLGEQDIVPTGVASDGTRLYVTDLTGRVWVFDLIMNS
jgi:hypothetical protein